MLPHLIIILFSTTTCERIPIENTNAFQWNDPTCVTRDSGDNERTRNFSVPEEPEEEEPVGREECN